MVTCHWFVNGVHHYEVFHIELLTKTQPRLVIMNEAGPHSR